MHAPLQTLHHVVAYMGTSLYIYIVYARCCIHIYNIYQPIPDLPGDSIGSSGNNSKPGRVGALGSTSSGTTSVLTVCFLSLSVINRLASGVTVAGDAVVEIVATGDDLVKGRFSACPGPTGVASTCCAAKARRFAPARRAASMALV